MAVCKVAKCRVGHMYQSAVFWDSVWSGRYDCQPLNISCNWKLQMSNKSLWLRLMSQLTPFTFIKGDARTQKLDKASLQLRERPRPRWMLLCKLFPGISPVHWPWSSDDVQLFLPSLLPPELQTGTWWEGREDFVLSAASLYKTLPSHD